MQITAAQRTAELLTHLKRGHAQLAPRRRTVAVAIGRWCIFENAIIHAVLRKHDLPTGTISVQLQQERHHLLLRPTVSLHRTKFAEEESHGIC